MSPEALARHIAPVVRDYVAQQLGLLRTEIDALRQAIDELPKPEKGDKGDPGEPGKDADMAALEKRIDERVEELKKTIPQPRDGRDGRDGIGVVDALRDAEGSLILTFSDGRIKNVGRVDGKDGKDGAPGKDANIDAIRQIVSEMTEGKEIDAEAIKGLMPESVRGQPGERGEPGESAYQIAVRLGFRGSEREWIESLRGEAGKDGADGKDADPVDYTLLQAEIKRLTEEAVKSIPQPRDGVDGKDVDMDAVMARIDELVKKIPAPKDGAPGEKGDRGERGPAGEPGRGIEKPFLRDGDLIIRYTDKTEDNLGRVVGPQGPQGYGFDDLRFEYDGERTLTAIWERGDTRKTQQFTLPIPIYIGVYKEGVEYHRGDNVTWAGSIWTAIRDTSAKPSEGDDWRLTVKKGRDGKNGRDGEKGERGPPGRPGRDLTQTDGKKKWGPSDV